MQRSYSEKSSNVSNGPGPNEPLPAAAAARAVLGRQRRCAAVRRLDDERRETENAHAIRDAMEGLYVGRMLAAGLLAFRALDELLLTQGLLRAERFRAVEGNAAHVVRGPGALQARMTPRRLRCSPVAVAVGRAFRSAGTRRSSDNTRSAGTGGFSASTWATALEAAGHLRVLGRALLRVPMPR